MAKNQGKRISQVEFLKVCDSLRNKREVIEKECYWVRQVVEIVREDCAVHAGDSTMESALEATGIKLAERPKNPAAERINYNRILCRSLCKLYAQLGAEIPADLSQMWDTLEGKPLPQNFRPIPMSKVQDPKTITVLNKGETPKP